MRLWHNLYKLYLIKLRKYLIDIYVPVPNPKFVNEYYSLYL